jgi:hypothetical protein
MSKKQKLNEGMFDFITQPYRSIRGAISGGMAGYSSAKGTDDKNQAKENLIKETEAAWKSFEASLNKAGYSKIQIADMKDAFDANIRKLIDYAISAYFP